MADDADGSASNTKTKKPKAAAAPIAAAERLPRKSNRPFPAHAFADALEFAQAIQDATGEQAIRRITLFDHLNRSPESSASRTLITSSGKYGLTKGSYKSELLELTNLGSRATSPDVSATVRARAKFESAIEQVAIFKSIYDKHQNQRLPSTAVLLDSAKEFGAPSDAAQECVDTFVSNLKSVGALKTFSGAERIVPIEHALEQLPRSEQPDTSPLPRHSTLLTSEAATFEQTCFVISPIGDDGTEFRRHADMILNSFIEPALQDLGLKVVR